MYLCGNEIILRSLVRKQGRDVKVNIYVSGIVSFFFFRAPSECGLSADFELKIVEDKLFISLFLLNLICYVCIIYSGHRTR